MTDTDRLPAAPEVVQIEVGLMQNFCEILYCPHRRVAAIVDPAWEVDRLLRAAADLQLRLTDIFITHTHHDHIEGVAALQAATSARVFVHPHEADRVQVLVPAERLLPLRDRLDLAIGDRGVRALETFGHTVGGVSFLADGFVVTGDVLFVGGCGRTDLQGGNTSALYQSLQRLCALPEETRIFPGHDYGTTPTSTVGREMLENPYLRCPDLESFRRLRERARRP